MYGDTYTVPGLETSNSQLLRGQGKTAGLCLCVFVCLYACVCVRMCVYMSVFVGVCVCVMCVTHVL